MEIFTHSRRSAGLECPRRHHLSYIDRLRPASEADPLRTGRLWHRVCEGADPSSLRTDLFTEQILLSLKQRYSADFTVELVEIPFAFERDGYGEAGKIDGIVRSHGRLMLLERKTARSFSPDYFLKLENDAQTATYFQAARDLGFDVQGVLYEVQEWPLLQPADATPEEKRKYTKGKVAKDGTVIEEPRLYANQRLVPETPAEFRVRVDEWADAQPRLHVREVGMPTDKLEAALEDARQLAHFLMQRPQWRNPAACTRCAFLPICHRTDLADVIPEGYVRLDTPHPELMETINETA